MDFEFQNLCLACSSFLLSVIYCLFTIFHNERAFEYSHNSSVALSYVLAFSTSSGCRVSAYFTDNNIQRHQIVPRVVVVVLPQTESVLKLQHSLRDSHT